ncbi:nucleolar protein dao-5-like [Anopheles maculipalpis]|uniref:nucleolar protein dao-5-like n=1 Tax=Anopheles maculipalpis TaxID=1496333 RepID=UPI002158E23D|nr:nucleolar protein dao-5-like [Anopheles maculipalpis]
MNRLEEAESTPKKRNPKQQPEAVAKDAVTKSGRKVKRPAHLDSPERVLSASLSSDARKSVAARAHKATEPAYTTTPSKRTATKEQVGSPEELHGSRKTIASTKKTHPGKQLEATPKGKLAKESIVDDSVGISKSGRKIKIPAKLAEFDSDLLSSPSRKNIVPDEDEPTKDKPTKTPGRAKPAVKNIAVNDDDEEENNKRAARKTPGRRAKSVALTDQPDEENVSTPRRRGLTSLLQKEEQPAEPSHAKTPGKRVEKSFLGTAANTQLKTPGRRAKSMAPVADATEEKELKTSVKIIQTPGRRAGKSIVNAEENSKSARDESPAVEQVTVPKTPGRKATKSMVPTASVESPTAQGATTKTPGRPRLSKSNATDKIESSRNLVNVDTALHYTGTQASGSSAELLSRSGRKIKPKKVFDFEHDVKTTEQTADGSKKRKVENTEESSIDTTMLSPMSRKATACVDDAQQTPKQKSRQASQTDNDALVDGSISRSGRKIKPKKMFGFEDGESSADLLHITGASPTVDKKPAGGDKTAKAKSVSTPAKARAASSVETDRGIDEAGAKQSFITRRGVDDHHRGKLQHSLDEADHAVAGSEPMIIRTSIGFGKPKVQNQTPSLQRAEGDDDDENIKRAMDSARLVGNSRSDTTTSSNHQLAVTVKGKQTVRSSPEQKADEEQTPEESCATNSLVENADTDEMMATDEAGVDIPEGPVKMFATENEPPIKNITENDEEQMPEQESNTAESDSNGMDVEPEKDLVDVEKDQEAEVAINDSQMVEQKAEDEPEKQQTDREEEGCFDDKNNLLNNVTLPDVMNSDGSESVAQPDATEEKALPEVLMENSTEKDAEVAQCKTTDREDTSIANIESEANGSAEPKDNIKTIPHDEDVSVAGAVDDIQPEMVEQTSEVVVPTDDINASTAIQNDAEMLEETPFGDIEYLEDEKSNIVEHIQKPSSPHEGLSVSSSSLEEAVTNHTTLFPTVVPSIIIVQETPHALNDTFSPVIPSRGISSSGVTVIDITADTPRPAVAAAAPRTPDSKLLTGQEASDKCSPDKPPEVIEIIDSPAVAAFCKQINDQPGAEGGSATSTPLAVRSVLLQFNQEFVNEEQQEPVEQNEGRKRSLSASAADMTMKRNVTFHSPANSTMLVETIDERLMLKSLQEQQQQQQDTIERSSCSKGIGEKLRKPRNRSLSEHKPSEMKRKKVSKLPNFKSIHANHFNRMESLAEFMKRKESRAKQILSSCGSASKLLSNPSTITTDAVEKPSDGKCKSAIKKVPPPTTKPFVFKSAGGGGIPVPSSGVVAGLFVKRTKEAPMAAKAGSEGSGEHHHQTLSATATVAPASVAKKPIPSDTERMANRLKQFQTTFKPKQMATGMGDNTVKGPLSSTASTSHTTVGGERPVDQLRSKQSKILKGVRTNRRFELQMKHRDNVQHK